MIILNLNTFNCVSLALVHDVGVNLRGADVSVGEQVRDGVYVGAFCYLEGGEGVTEAVEGDVLGYAGILQPVLERFLRVVALEVLENESSAGLAAEFIGLLREGKGGFGVGLFGLDADAPATVLGFYNVAPIEREYVADTQAGETTEKGGFLQIGRVAGRGGQLTDFFDGEVLSAPVHGLDGFEVVVDVLLQEFLLISDFEEAAEGGPVSGGGILGEFLAGVLELFGIEQVVAEAFAEGDRDVAHLAFASAVVAEMVVDTNPLLVLRVQFGLEVGEEVHLQLGAVQEVVLAADDGQFALGAERFGLGDFHFIGILVGLEFGLVLEVDAQVFVPDVLLGLRVAEGRVEVEVERNLAAWQQPLAKCYFSCSHYRLSF